MKKKIVDQSIQLFLQYGYKSVTMDDIAKHMGVSKKTIYVHFPTKDELVEQSAVNHLDGIIKKINVISKQSKDPIIELYQIKKEALNHLSSEKNSPQYQLQKYYPSLYSKLKEKEFSALSGLFSNSIQEGIQTGIFRKDIDVDFVVRIFFNGIRGITNIKLFPIEIYKIEDLLLNFSEYHLRALCTHEGIIKLENYKKEMDL
ncbi:TetR/AcrR family transcriptional regulator [Flavobacteriaceae bacterium]|jgi:AcrR family transcriptional regulator|nr:TetR/AcrR family transcriptional regulator [Flavobacteriaceae bacterium]MDA8849038.1 TetR/AcrR family transcriptional regulator [Flavobacteriaceae bacterium]MDB4062529.1 TetR/AcrR family transcriptional regulator [Flavobacteriaceae bacterium]MDB4255092.1 TetR/AcrR family transcriptional regulator [Flavobacteriaceae bacterium]MDC0001022.1 TetR/AcrR family transcriptional regulator [Flavobacteriaceae bacterium]|tara:strand:+ start:1597 stop:2202 length:606 start_codon:yes stop_codon:yes gene_type:complete